MMGPQACLACYDIIPCTSHYHYLCLECTEMEYAAWYGPAHEESVS